MESRFESTMPGEMSCVMIRIHECGEEKKHQNFRSRRLTARINRLEAFQVPLQQWLVKGEETRRGWYTGGRWVCAKQSS